MRKMFTKLLGLLCGVIIVVGGITAVNNQKIDAAIAAEGVLPEGTTVLVLGDSHVVHGINDSLVDGMVNRGRWSENYYYSQTKLNHYIANNPEIESLVLSLNYFTFSKRVDSNIDGDSIKDFYPYYFPLIVRDKVMLAKIEKAQHKSEYRENLLISIGFPNKTMLSFSDKEFELEYSIGYKSHQPEHIGRKDLLEKSVGRHYGSFDSQNPELYLGNRVISDAKSLVKRAEELNLKVVFVNTPQHEAYNRRIPKEVIRMTDSIAHLLSASPNVHYINWYDMALPDSCYFDYDHLSGHGAAIITPMLRDTLQKLGVIE